MSSYTPGIALATRLSDGAQSAGQMPSMLLETFLNTTLQDCGLASQNEIGTPAEIESMKSVCRHFSTIAQANKAIPADILHNIQINHGTLADIFNGKIQLSALNVSALEYLPRVQAIMGEAFASHTQQMRSSQTWHMLASLFSSSRSGDSIIWSMDLLSQLAFFTGLSLLGWDIWNHRNDAGAVRAALSDDSLDDDALNDNALPMNPKRPWYSTVDCKDTILPDGTTRRSFDCTMRRGSEVWKGEVAENSRIQLDGCIFSVELRWELRDKQVWYERFPTLSLSCLTIC